MKKNKVVIASITTEKYIEKAIKYKDNLKAVFILIGNFINIKEYIKLFQSYNIHVYIHIEKIKGLKLDEFGFNYIKNVLKPNGIITTKNRHVKLAKNNNIFVIQRFFLADHDMKNKILESAKISQPDMIEIMPVITSFLLDFFQNELNIPILMGGLVDEREYVNTSILQGAVGISTSNLDIWKTNFTNS